MTQFTDDETRTDSDPVARDEEGRPAPRGGAINTTRGVLREAIGATGEVGSGLVDGVSHLARDLVRGVRDIGGEVTLVARDGVSGLIGVVGQVGGAAIHTVTDLLVDAVGGVREIAGAAVGHARANGARGTAAARSAAQRDAAQRDVAPEQGLVHQEQASRERHEAPV